MKFIKSTIFFSIIAMFSVIALSAKAQDLGTVNLVNHTDCVCLYTGSLFQHCQESAGSGVTIYTFQVNQGFPTTPPYSSISDNSTGIAPIVNENSPNTIVTSTDPSANTSSNPMYPMKAGATYYAILSVFPGSSLFVGVIPFKGCPSILNTGSIVSLKK